GAVQFQTVGLGYAAWACPDSASLAFAQVAATSPGPRPGYRSALLTNHQLQITNHESRITAPRGPPPRTRAGSISSARRNSNSAEQVMPTRRSGSDSSHTSGHRTRASSASGQHRTSSTHQADRANRVFIG